MEILFKSLDDDMPVPRLSRETDIGFDLRSRDNCLIKPGERCNIHTGLAISLPKHVAGLVIPRSGLAAKHGLSIVNSPGLIDPGYHGEIIILAINLGADDIHISRMERCAQMMFVSTFTNIPWVKVNEFPDSDRGAAGFGSSGNK